MISFLVVSVINICINYIFRRLKIEIDPQLYRRIAMLTHLNIVYSNIFGGPSSQSFLSLFSNSYFFTMCSLGNKGTNNGSFNCCIKAGVFVAVIRLLFHCTQPQNVRSFISFVNHSTSLNLWHTNFLNNIAGNVNPLHDLNRGKYLQFQMITVGSVPLCAVLLCALLSLHY